MKTLTSLIALILLGTASMAQSGIIGDPVTNSANGHIHYLLARTNWTAAEAEAEALGGHLATINDAAEKRAFDRDGFGGGGRIPADTPVRAGRPLCN